MLINRIKALFRENSHLKRIYLTPDFHKDISWFLTFLPSFNGISYLKEKVVDSVQFLHLDACLTGMGGVWRDCVYATPLHNLGGLDLKIVHLEMLNLVIALRTWGSSWCHSSITVYCENLGVVCVVKTGKTKDPFLALCLRNIWLLTAHYDTDLDIAHIPGCQNTIADALSRIYSSNGIDNSLLRIRGNTYLVVTLTWTFICNFRFQPSFSSPHHGCSPENQNCLQTFYQESPPHTFKDLSVIFNIYVTSC